MGIIQNMWPFARSSDEQFELLLRPHLKALYSLAFRLTGQADDAEDLVQELLLKIYPRLEEMQAIDKLLPWLSRILYRMFVDQYRRQKRSPISTVDNDTELYEAHASSEAEPSEVVNGELTQTLLQQALDKLNEDQRLLVMLHDVEGYSLNEISEMTDVPVGTLKSRHNRARGKLREVIHKMEPKANFGRVYEHTG